jgi:hypothetical protein
MKRAVAVVGAVFGVALAVMGSRLSAGAMGVVCGAMASVPASLVLIWALVRRTQGAGADIGRTELLDMSYRRERLSLKVPLSS